MKTRTARTLGDTPGAQFKLLQRLERRDQEQRRRELAKTRTTATRFRRWLAVAFGI